MLDKNRKPVRGLTGADFTILENGKPQTVAAFGAVELPDLKPPSAPWIRDVAPDVKTNFGSQQRRLFIIAIDDATIENDVAAIKSVKDIATGIVNRLGPADVASVVFTRDNRNSQDFTNDRARLLTAVNSFTVGFRGQATAANAGLGTPDAGAEDLWYLSSVNVLDRAVDFLTDVSERRKAIIYVGQGIPFDISDAVISVNATPTAASGATSTNALQMRIKDQMADVFDRAQRANVTIYSVDPCGLRQPPPQRVPGAKPAPATCVTGLEVDYLQNIAAATGGRAIVNGNDFEPGLNNVFLENSSYYLIGFAPGDPAHDGKFRKVEVKVNRPDVEVRTRSGYDAPRDESADRPRPAASPLMKALGGVVPTSDLPMQIMAAPFALPDKKSETGATVAVAIGLKQPIRQMEEQNIEAVDMQVAAYNTDGRSFGNMRKRADVTIRANAAGMAEYEVFGTIDLKPGRYQLRIAANVGSLTTAGSVYYDVDVPDFATAPLSLSGLLITATPNPVFAPKEGLQPVIPVIPTTRRAFAPATHAVSAFARVYQPAKGKLLPVNAHLTVRDAKDAVVYDRQMPLAANLFNDTRSTDVKLDIPIAELPAGDYVLTLETSAGTSSARRDSRFQIVK